ncbi:MAG: hypothetical protein WDZ35_07620 [Crocinitomicaceae bacterium]
MTVKDPELIKVFKNLLNYRKNQEAKSDNVIKQLMITRAIKSEKDIKAGRLLTRAEMDKKSKSV